MKLNRFTKVCFNLALILLIALLAKNLITVPKEMYAQRTRPPTPTANIYKASLLDDEFETLVAEAGREKLGTQWWDKMTPNEKWTYMFNWNASRGWNFHSFIAFDEEVVLVFTR
jgi:hypothetical protein